MLPKIVIHNSISLDGSLTGFMPNMELHYQIMGQYQPQGHLIGSHTIKEGIKLFEQGVPAEELSDFQKPQRDLKLPLWVIIDSKGILHNLLHTCRRFEFCRDILILVAEQTPKKYLDYLSERSYSYEVIGTHHVDLKKACTLLYEKYNIKLMVTDCGKILGNLLLEQGLVQEISILIHPEIIGKKSYTMFSNLEKPVNITLEKSKVFDEKYIWNVYRVNNEQ